MAVVYVIRCLKNGRAYIGVTAHMDKRRKQHFSELARNVHHNKPMQAAWNKYGALAFSFDVLHKTEDYGYARELEGQLLYSFFDDGLFNTTNKNSGFMLGNPSKTGTTLSESIKAKIGNANRGRKHSAEARQKISAALFGNTFTKGKKQSQVTIEKKRIAGKVPNSGHYRPTTFYLKDGVTYAGSKAASLATGIPRTTLMKHAARNKNGWSICKVPDVAVASAGDK